MTLTRLKVYTAILAVVIGFAIVQRVDQETDPRRAVTITVTWTTHPSRVGPGHIDAVGQIGKNQPFVAESTSDNPFIESGLAYLGEPVQVQAWALDGPFGVFRCAISGARHVQPPQVWEGLRVLCKAIV